MNAREFIDLEIVGANCWKIGKIKDVVVDPKNWQVTALDVELEKSVADEFSFKHRLSKTHVPLSVNHIQGIGDRVVLKSSKEELFQQVAATAAYEQKDEPRSTQ